MTLPMSVLVPMTEEAYERFYARAVVDYLLSGRFGSKAVDDIRDL